MKTEFAWKGSYMGTVWFHVSDDTGSYIAEFRKSAGEYELSIANGDDVRRDVVASIGILRRQHATPEQWKSGRAYEMPESTIAAFNAWQLAERAEFIAKMKAAPERYGDIDESDSFLFPPIITARRGWYETGVGWITDNSPKSAGQIAYETDTAARPNYHDGAPRRPWPMLPEIARYSWERNPTPR